MRSCEGVRSEQGGGWGGTDLVGARFVLVDAGEDEAHVLRKVVQNFGGGLLGRCGGGEWLGAAAL